MKDISEVLKSVNAGRAVLTLPPISVLPPGHRFAPRFSPISRAFEGRLTLLERTVRCDSQDLAERLAISWDMPQADEGQVELPAAIRSFLRAFEDGLLPQFESKLCTVSGCPRTAAIIRGDVPMCDQCAEEWESVRPLLAHATRKLPGAVAQPVRAMTTRLIFAVTHFFRWVTSFTTLRRCGTPKQGPTKSDNSGSSGGSPAA